jgi:hypothetical protein
MLIVQAPATHAAPVGKTPDLSLQAFSFNATMRRIVRPLGGMHILVTAPLASQFIPMRGFFESFSKELHAAIKNININKFFIILTPLRGCTSSMLRISIY